MRDTENIRRRLECTECGTVDHSEAGHGETIWDSHQSNVWCTDCGKSTLHDIEVVRDN